MFGLSQDESANVSPIEELLADKEKAFDPFIQFWRCRLASWH